MSEFILRINTILQPIERYIQQYKKYIGYALLLLAFLSFGFLFFPESLKFTGEQSMNVLWGILFLPILARVFGISIARVMMPLRKELGILMGVLAFIHGVTYIVPYPTILGESYFWLDDTTMISYLAFGFLALLFTIPLTLTSNTWMMKKMGKYWKILHRTVYLIAIFTVVHVVLLKWYREFEVGQVILLGVYFAFKILEWRGFSFVKKDAPKVYPKGQKWLCVPCGYIYDPVIGDEADGIAPGTEFSDIPDNWYCPLCGVTKSDFVPLEEDAKSQTGGYEARIIEKTLLNPVTLKLIIELTDDLKSIPGQFATFVWSDAEGEFSRSYSIAEHDGQKLTFFIKLTELGRGARVLRDISSDATIRIRGIFGRFVLQSTDNPKIFIATGTGLAPIYNMIRALPENIQSSLYFTVATGNELFYTEELQRIDNLDLHIHTTKEELPGYAYGRVSIDDIVASPDAEWYLCGNPRMVAEAREKLSARGYEKVYSEEFN